MIIMTPPPVSTTKQNFKLRHLPPPYPSADDGAITKSGLKTSAGNSDGVGQHWYSCRKTHLSILTQGWKAAGRHSGALWPALTARSLSKLLIYLVGDGTDVVLTASVLLAFFKNYWQ